MKASNKTKQWMRTIRSIIGRKKDLSPWLEWFATMQTFVESGLLEIYVILWLSLFGLRCIIPLNRAIPDRIQRELH